MWPDLYILASTVVYLCCPPSSLFSLSCCTSPPSISFPTLVTGSSLPICFPFCTFVTLSLYFLPPPDDLPRLSQPEFIHHLLPEFKLNLQMQQAPISYLYWFFSLLPQLFPCCSSTGPLLFPSCSSDVPQLFLRCSPTVPLLFP